MSEETRYYNSMARMPKTLKDFLSENSSSCSSSGFKSLPRKPNNKTTLTKLELNSPFQTLINTIRSISFFTTVKKSRKNKSFCKGGSTSTDIKASTVKIKDIIRWKSFRDLVEEHHLQPPPLAALDFHRCTNGCDSTTAATTSTWSSSGSSWSDSDFSTSGSVCLSSWETQNDVVGGNKFPSLEAKGVSTCKDDEQHSPVSVLQIGDHEFSPFDQSLANIERKKQKFMQTFQRLEGIAKFDQTNLDQCLFFDEKSGYYEGFYGDDEEIEEHWIEERAKQLLYCVKATGSMQSSLDTLLLDFFRDELSGRRNQTMNDDDEFELEIMRIAKDWLNGSFAYDTGHVDKDAFIKDMDREGRWGKFEDEQEKLAQEIETAILHNLVVDLLDLDG